MITRPRSFPIAVLALLAVCVAAPLSAAEQERWDKDVGKPAPELVPSAWIGSPVSLAAVRGNTVVLAFWNADIPC